MNNHLSRDQIAMWTIGLCTAEEEAHGRDCPVCSVELARFQVPVSTLRRALHDWSRTRTAPSLEDFANNSSGRRLRGHALLWGMPAATVFILAAALWAGYAPRASKPDPVGLEDLVSEQRQDDAAMMDAIAIRLSRPIPAPMKPILSLIPPMENHFEGGSDETQ